MRKRGSFEAADDVGSIGTEVDDLVLKYLVVAANLGFIHIFGGIACSIISAKP